jgi:2-hydroxy-3-keto-5-methylthiopentenyl-1-phosphate phosphatase
VERFKLRPTTRTASKGASMTHRPLSKAVLLSDFDETIVNIDTGEFALEHFGDPNWKRIEEEYERGNMTFEESLQKEFGTIKVPQRVILDELDKVVVFRRHFEELIEYCKGHVIPFTVVSGGLEFCIRHFLDRNDWLNFVDIRSPRAEYTPEGYVLTFPELFDRDSVNFKHDLVRYHRRRGSKVFYIGDGLGDYPAAKEADVRFAVKGSRLAHECRKGNLQHKEITDFQEVIEAVDELPV